MKFSVPGKDQAHEARSGATPQGRRTAETEDTGQPVKRSVNRLASNFILAICAGCTTPPIVIFTSIAQLNAQAIVVVTAYTALVIFYIFSTMARMHADLCTARLRLHQLSDDMHSLEAAYRRTISRHNSKIAVPIRIKRTSKNAVAGSSGVSSDPATVDTSEES